MTIELALSRGLVAVIDDEDADLAQFKWSAHVQREGEGKTAYAYRTVGGRKSRKNFSLHQAVFFRAHGYLPIKPMEIDHEDRDGLNNRRSNLRELTHQENIRNIGLRSDNRSGCSGVYWSKQIGKWVAQIKADGRLRHLGCFVDLQEAIITRKEAERIWWNS